MVVAAFADFMQQVVSGLAAGGVYALLALALVIIHRSTGVINFAQGEMALLSTYIAWALITHHGWSYWPAFVATLVISFAGGVATHRVVIRPVVECNRCARAGRAIEFNAVPLRSLPRHRRRRAPGIFATAARNFP